MIALRILNQFDDSDTTDVSFRGDSAPELSQILIARCVELDYQVYRVEDGELVDVLEEGEEG